MKIPNPNKDKITAIACGIALSSILAISSAFADDTEVFFGQVTTDSATHPNVMFVLDTSGSMDNTDGTGESRSERMKDAMFTILDETSNVNVGLMRLNGSNGGSAVLHPIRPIDALDCEGVSCGTLSLVVKVGESAGDAEEIGPTPPDVATAATMSLNGNSLLLGKSDAGNARKIGLHFGSLAIPQGATITSARLEFQSDANNASIAAYSIGAEQIDSATIFTNTDDDLSSRALSQLAPWNPEAWIVDEDYHSADISNVVQEITDRTNWCGGNNMNIVIEGTGKRSIRSYEAWATSAPILRLNFTTTNIPVGGGCMRVPALSSVASSNDDAEEQPTKRGRMYVTSGDLEMPKDGNREQLVGVRFPNLDIPQGSVIESAVMEFTVDNNDYSENVTMNISAQAIGDAPSFGTGKKDISKRARTTAVSWVNPPAVGIGQPVETDDVSVALQEVISRGDWSQGNAVAFIISAASGSGIRDYQSFDDHPNTPVKLKVIYKGVVSSGSGSQVTIREKYKSLLNEMVAYGGTPIVDAYYEASLYMTGGEVDYGLERGRYLSYNRQKYHRVSHPLSMSGGTLNRDSDCKDDDLNAKDCSDEKISGTPTYISPMVSSCQTNHIVFLTDGQPTSNSSSAKVRSLIGATDPCSTQGDPDELCGRELAEWLNETDHNPGLTGKQTISTYTIGFNYDGDFLKDLAQEGDGQYFKAESSSQLVGVFKDILGDVLAVDTSFVAPGATVNQFNRLTHRNDIYFALFKPDNRPTWDGNLKRYEIGTNASGEIAILDANLEPAVDESTGFFHSESESWWSDAQDGNTVAKGGAAEELFWDSTGEIPSRRTITYLEDYSTIPVTGADLMVASSKLHESNNNITLTELGIQNITGTDIEKDEFRDDLLKWSRGIDIKDANDDNDFTDYRKTMGDPMHARPVIVNYASANDVLSTVFVGTNEGYLHAIDRDEGKELYAYMPKELISNIRPFYDNQSSSSHPYGMDGAMSIWTQDLNNNVMIDPGEKAYLYSGMRRGGNNYYALDVSERLTPKLKWVIEGGTTGFEELGQTWSRAVPNQIMFNSVERNVLIFAAGYDTNQDPDPTGTTMAQAPDSVGRGFYIVDAETGVHIWSVLGSNRGGDSQYIPELKYSVPSNIRALDTNNDGLTDQLYFGDMGGQVWRFDFAQYHESGDLLTGGIIADLNGNSPQNHRRFYYEPDIAVIANEGQRFLSISIGSGWRAHPLNQVVNDRFYVLRSNNVITKPEQYGMLDTSNGSYRPIMESDLVNVTDDIDTDAGPHGWYIEMAGDGEKVLANSVTVNNQVIFSSYKPTVAASACSTAIGGGAVYVLNILNGSPRIDIDGDGDIDEDDRSEELAHGGIPPEPAVLITENGPTVLVGPEQPVEPDFQNLTQRTYWFKPGDEAADELVEVHGN